MRFVCSKNLMHIVRDQENAEGSMCEQCGADVVEMDREQRFIMSLQQRALKEAPRPQGVKGACAVRIVVCTACGAPIWRGTDPLPPSEKFSKVVLEREGIEREPPLCQNCEAIRYRYPEIYFWVNNTAFWRRNRVDILERLEKQCGKRKDRERPDRKPSPTNGKPEKPGTASKKTSKKKKPGKRR